MNIVGKNYPFALSSESECAHLAKKISAMLHSVPLPNKGFHVWFCGDLGSGKTTLIRYILHSMGHTGRVKSPTYTLCETYILQISSFSLELHHFDLYRMNHPLEWEEAGFRDILLRSGINCIEWPEKAENTLPAPDVTIHLHYVSENVREGYIEGNSLLGLQLLDQYF
jgi:tRNA threonylcarbamoyladenosine biosynthesis protein TsaE